MKNSNKSRKGFTIVELVIVIAVIAILAGVLIPTFSSIVTKANESKVLQEAKNAYTEAVALDIAKDGLVNEDPAPSGKITKYEANGTAVTEFEYTDGAITATLNTSTGEWTVANAQ